MACSLRPLSEQQQDLEATALSVSVNPVNPVRRREREGGEGEGKNERVSDRTETFGSGMVSVVEASESDRYSLPVTLFVVTVHSCTVTMS